MKALEKAQELVIDALRALPQSSPLGESIRTQIRGTQTELAGLRREQATLRGAGAATRMTRTGGRLLTAALHAQSNAEVREKANLRPTIELLLRACAELLEAETASPSALSSDAPATILHTPESIQQHLDAFGSLCGVRIQDVTGVLSLAGIDLADSEWKDCDLSDSTLKRAKLRGAIGARIRAQQTSFVEADLRGVKLPGLDASHADANGAVFEGADLTGACFRGASLEGAVLRGVIARDVIFDRARLIRADVRSSSLAGATFRFADLSHAQLDQSILVGGTLAHANLHRTSREGANLTNTDLRGARATDSDRARAEDFRRST